MRPYSAGFRFPAFAGVLELINAAMEKPVPELFLTAASRMGIESARCLVVEDAPSGVQAAKTAGARCIAVTNSVNADQLQQADIICDSLEKIDIEKIISLIEKNS